MPDNSARGPSHTAAVMHWLGCAGALAPAPAQVLWPPKAKRKKARRPSGLPDAAARLGTHLGAALWLPKNSPCTRFSRILLPMQTALTLRPDKGAEGSSRRNPWPFSVAFELRFQQHRGNGSGLSGRRRRAGAPQNLQRRGADSSTGPALSAVLKEASPRPQPFWRLSPAPPLSPPPAPAQSGARP
ncbi:uncharacterized protein LOC144377423 isoform X2 [Ictidomys tridecemlineatus]